MILYYNIIENILQVINIPIVNILGSIDDKIENNEKLCEKLEILSYKLFLGKILENTLFDYTLADLCEITMGQSPDGASINTSKCGMLFYQGRTDFGSVFPIEKTYTTQPTRTATAGDILLSVRAPVGDINFALNNCCIGRGISAIVSLTNIQSVIWCILKSLKNEFDKCNGEGTVFGSINKKALYGMKIKLPRNKVLIDIEDIIAPLFNKIAMLFKENQKLLTLKQLYLKKFFE